MKLDKFKGNAGLFEATKDLFSQLNIPVHYQQNVPIQPKDFLAEQFRENSAAQQLIDDIFLVGLVDDAAFSNGKSIDIKKIQKDYDGFVIIAIDLKPRLGGLMPTRSQMAEVTRTFGRVFKYMPVTVIFRYEGFITLASAERVPYQQTWREGEKAGKVTLLRDIRIEHPHTGHLKILQNLKIDRTGAHPVNSYAELHKHWQAVFNLSILNKQFYKELSNWYFWALQHVHFPDDLEKDASVRNATSLIRLLTRLIFIWFIKEKSLVSEVLFNETELKRIVKDFNKNKSAANYYRTILQNLFFGTLNQQADERKFAVEGKSVDENKEHYGVKNLYRYQADFLLKEKEITDLFEDVPFLNGGLFDCLDKTNEKGKVIYVDGFSRSPKKQAVVPDFLFFSKPAEADLTKTFGAPRKHEPVRGLICILQDYKFTVAENTPIEEDVALDPELLGKVFENLLASYNPETQKNARNATGSFYTPREIVDYMVDESLIAYLQQKLEEEGIKDRNDDLRHLLSYSDQPPVFSESERKLLVNAIDNCKVLDPACGSGAFPMGVLHKMVHILHRLDPHNTLWQAQQTERPISEEMERLRHDQVLIAKIGDAQVRAQAEKAVAERIEAIKQLFANQDTDYARKLFLIENCIYGVDIQPIAVQIAKLRFFISLIVDQEKDMKAENFGIRALPNLETKFVAANTLIGIEKPDEKLLIRDKTVETLEAELKEVRHLYFTAKNRTEKKKLQTQDKALRARIADAIKNVYVNTHDAQIKQFDLEIKDQELKLKNNANSKANVTVIKQQTLLGEIEEVVHNHTKANEQAIKKTIRDLQVKISEAKDPAWQKTINESAKKLAEFDPYDQNAHAVFFDPEWMFGLRSKTTGMGPFDIVIGNPPYVDSETMMHTQPEFRKELKELYETAVGNWDLFVVFIERGFQLASGNGHLAFIVPNKFISAKYTHKLKEFLSRRCIHEIRDYSRLDVFTAADVYPVTFVASNLDPKGHKMQTIVMKSIFEVGFRKITPLAELYADNLWAKHFFSEEIQVILSRMHFGKSLVQYFPEIHGAATVGEAYAISEIVQEQGSKKLNGRSFKLVNTGTIDPYSNLWGICQTQYLKKRYDRPIITASALARINPIRAHQAAAPKLIVAGMSRSYEAIFDPGLCCAGKSTTIILGKAADLWLLLSFVNSRLASFWLRKNFGSLAMSGGYLNIGVEEISTLPIMYEELSKCLSLSILPRYLAATFEMPEIHKFYLILLDSAIYCIYFRVEIEKFACDVIEYLDGKLPELEDDWSDEKKLKVIEEVHAELSDPKHPVSIAIKTMREKVKEVRIIEGLPVEADSANPIPSSQAPAEPVSDGTDTESKRLNCFCTDASIAPVIAIQNPGQKWQLFGISEVHGMGNASHDKNLFGEEYDEVVPLNSFKGVAYIVYRQGRLWGAIQIKDNRTLECEIKKVSATRFSSQEELLTEMGIKRGEFR